MKSTDHFSSRAGAYSRFRPSYPPALFTWLKSLLKECDQAWDCGTGNGQVARALSAVFKQVQATDISDNQLKYAFHAPNITYSRQAAEKTSFRDDFFDLITVAQAIHWFDFDPFYREVNRTLKPDGVLAVMGYGLLTSDEKTDALLNRFYLGTLGPYWDAERKYIDEHYQTIPFPFDEIRHPAFPMEVDWTPEQFTGFLSSWSALQHLIKAKGTDPLPGFHQEILKIWPAGEVRKVSFPLLLRVGKPYRK